MTRSNQQTIAALPWSELYLEYKLRATAGEMDVIDGIAARVKIYPSTLLRGFKKRGLPTLNIKPKQPNQRLKNDGWVYEAHRRYMAGERMGTLEKEYGSKSNLWQLFTTRGLALRHSPHYTQFVKFPRKTEAEIEALITREAAPPRVERCSVITVPDELYNEWREWPLARRGDFIRRLRAALQLPNEMPTTPHSANVEPFDYGSERAWQIANQLNAGLPSRNWKVRIFPCAQGMIWREQLWFWTRRSDNGRREVFSGSYQSGKFIRGLGRPQLHCEIYRAEVGVIPPSHLVRFHDGNVNNLLPENLYLQSRADEASENSRDVRVKQTRELTALLLQRHQRKQKHEHPNDELFQRVAGARHARGHTGRANVTQ